VLCGRCGLAVLVRKHSPEHTMVQWPADTGPCTAATVVRSTGLRLGCDVLRDSIADAVRARVLNVPDLDRRAGTTAD
jgi:hypothetical protein